MYNGQVCYLLLIIKTCYSIDFLNSSRSLELLPPPLNVYWNVPSFQCNPFKLNFTDLLDRYGIIHNKNSAFRGEVIDILYDPGNFPAILQQNNKPFLRNGGVPQEGNLTSHLEIYTEIVEELIPSENFSGVAIIDFESWRPIYRQNWGVLMAYKNLSEDIEKQTHPLWPDSWIKKEAAKRFEEGAKTFMEETIRLSKKLRPYAKWGYYHYPYCFNTKMDAKCPKQIIDENDRITWLFNQSDVLYPSVYLQESHTPEQRIIHIESSLNEALRIKKNVNSKLKILVYFWYKFQDTGNYISKENLFPPLVVLSSYDIDGVILWGASDDVNSKFNCLKLYNYTETIFGPTFVQL